MRKTDLNRLQVLRRVRDFLQPMANDLALAGAFLELQAVIARLTDEAARQDGQRRQALVGTDTVTLLAKTLRNDVLRPVVHLARIVTPDALASGLGSGTSFHLPRVTDLERLLTASRGVYDTVKPYEDKLIAAGLPKGHLDRMVSTGEALKAAVDARAQSMLQRAAAGSSTIAQGRRAVQVLRLVDSLVRPLLRGDAGKMSAWMQAKRLGRVSAGASEVVVVPDSGVAPAASPEGRSAAEGVAGEVERAA